MVGAELHIDRSSFKPLSKSNVYWQPFRNFDELLSVYSILNYLVKGRYGKKFLRTLKKKRVIAFRLLHVSSLYFSLFGRYQKNFERLVAVLNVMLKSY